MCSCRSNSSQTALCEVCERHAPVTRAANEAAWPAVHKQQSFFIPEPPECGDKRRGVVCQFFDTGRLGSVVQEVGRSHQCTATLLPTLEAEVPETWLAFEDRLHYSAQVALGIKEKPIVHRWPENPQNKLLVVDYSSPIPVWSVKSVTSYGERCGLGKDEAQFVLPYLHQVSSVLYFPCYPSLRLTVFGLVSFVVDVLKAIFRHDHDRSLQYDVRFCQHPNAVSHDKFEEMKSDLVHNACLAMPMLLALWSDFKLETHHLDVFLKLLIQFEFAYILAGSQLEQTAMMLCSAPCFEDDQSDQEDKQPKSDPLESTDVLSEGEGKQPESGNDQ